MESEAALLHAGTRAGLIDPEKGTAALVVFAQLKKMGAAFSFGDFLVERGLLSRMSLEGLENNLRSGSPEAVRTISQLGDFELLELIGEGHSGSVFRARQVSLDRAAAVKVLSPALAQDQEALQRFLAEARMSARVRDPHVVQSITVDHVEGLYYLAMEFMEGGSARALLEKSGGWLGEARALELAGQVARGLAAAHAAGLVHRDVKPENILLTRDGLAKLSDLGIAARRDLGSKTSEFWGTPEYLAPEIVRSPGSKDPRSDLYSLGATLYEFLTGRPPFLAASPKETLRMHTRDAPQDVRLLRPDLSAQAAALVMRLLNKDPAQRFPGAPSVVQAVELIGELRARGSLLPPGGALQEWPAEDLRPKRQALRRAVHPPGRGSSPQLPGRGASSPRLRRPGKRPGPGRA